MSLDPIQLSNQFTGAEKAFLAALADLAYSNGDIIYYDSGTSAFKRLAIGNSNDVLTVTGGVPVWSAAAASGANTALSNLASVAINASLVPGSSGAIDLGSTTKMWGNLFLASGGVINFNNGNYTITHSAGLLTTNGALTLGGTLALGTNSLTMTGSIGATGARVTKVWTTDLEITNLPSVNGTALTTTIAKLNFLTNAAGTTGTTSTNIVFSTSPTLVTPILGTPTSGTLTNCTGLPVSTGISGLGTGVATALAVNVGSAGAFVTFNGALGTPSSGTLTNATGLPISSGVSGLGTGVATFLATPSSANLASALTDESGSGLVAFTTGASLTGPKIVAGNGLRDGLNNLWIARDTLDTASTVNYITVYNATTTNGPSIQATGSDTNIDLGLGGQGTGKVKMLSSVNFQDKNAYFTEHDNGNSGTTLTVDWTKSNKQKITMTGNCTFTFTAPNGPCSLVLKLVQDGTGSRLATWPAAVKWSGGTAPTLTTTASKTDVVTLYYDGTNYYGGYSLNY